VLVAPRDHLAAALAMFELDGVARRLIVVSPDLAPEHLPVVAAKAGADAIVSDREGDDALGVKVRVVSTGAITAASEPPPARCRTEWVLQTTGTTGPPKLVRHTYATLTAAIAASPAPRSEVVWGTFYDVRRYGGLQIFFRALLGRASLVLSDATESPGDYLARLAAHRVTHVSGTPSHWRRALMVPEARAIAPRYIRLSGEIADQGILTALRRFYPQAKLGHAYASTEAGVAFEVADGLEGFPAHTIGTSGDVHVRILDGTLRIRSPRCATAYVGEEQTTLTDDEGFVDTGDVVERRGDRYYFLGRRSGIINVGGLKVHPEEVEAAINRHPAVRMSMVRSRRSPITGAIVAADVVLTREPDGGATDDFEREIRQICHDRLAPHKIPATIRFVPALQLAAGGKVPRHV
jgi:acyl-coenzyme A synthetase/AMP-(fatty) acid ligase